MLDLRNLCDMLCLPETDRESLRFAQTDIDSSEYAFLTGGILTPCEPAHYVDCVCECGNDHCDEIRTEITKDGVPQSFAYCPETMGSALVDPSTLSRWRLNESAIAKALADALQCPGCAVRVTRGLWKLGMSKKSVAGFRREFFFATKPSAETYASLPHGTTPLLITGCSRPEANSAYADRTILMADLVHIEQNVLSVDWEFMDDRLGTMVKPEKKKPKAKTHDLHHRESLIKDIIRAHMKSAREFYFNNRDRGAPNKKYAKLTLEMVSSQLEPLLDKPMATSTVHKTVTETTDNELKILWKTRNDTGAIMRFQG